MTPALWAVRAVNLVLVLAAAWLAARGRAVSVAIPAAVAALVCGLQGAAVFSGKLQDERLRRMATGAGCLADVLVVVWIAQWTQEWAGAVDLGSLAPASVLALEFGPLAGAVAAVLPTAFTALLIMTIGQGPAAPGVPAALALRAGLLALGPVAAGLALGPARAAAAASARATLGRLRSAQVGEYLSFALFQLRDYAITIASLSEAVAIAPKDDPKFGERVERLRKAASELGSKLSRVLGDQTALTTARPTAAAPIDLARLAGACIEECRAAFAPDGVQASLHVEGAVPPVKSDRRSVELALMAVLQNSFEACAARGGGAVTVILRAEGRNAEIEIDDDGGGIGEAEKTVVFEPFLSAKRASHGLGLGLSMSRRFMERIGGSLRLKSKGGYTAALLVVPVERELPNIRLEDSTWAGRRDA